MLSLRFRLMRFGLVAAMALAARPAIAQGTLKWSFKQGDTLKYAFAQASDIKMTRDGQQNSNKIELNVDLAWSVSAVNKADGSAQISQTVDRVRAKITFGGNIMNYDSKDKQTADPGAQVIAKIYDAVVGKPYTFTISATGQIGDVKVPEAVTTAITGTTFAGMADSGSFLSPKGVENMMAQVLPKLDPKAMAKGATWAAELSLPADPLTMKLKTTYTLADMGPRGKIDADIATAITTPPGSPLTVTVNKQSGKGAFTFDTTAGRLVDATVNQSFDMTVKGPNTEIGQVIAISQSLKAIP